MEAVRARSLTVRRGGKEVLKSLDFGIPAGRITGLLGPSGCGKTTLMRSIVGVQVVASGEITVFGEPAGARALRTEVGYVTQAPSIYRDLSVQENLAYFAKVLGASAERVERVIESVDLSAYAGQVAANLSGGQLSRVSLATALLGGPRLLVLDEPTIGLDPILRRQLWETFSRLAAQGTTMLVSSHVIEEADHCDRLLLMREGRLLPSKTPAELRRQTGEAGLEDAFLALIEREGAG
ncbi:MAG: ABC transporter ATP-binding protein [Solirubrobacterales bacterium]